MTALNHKRLMMVGLDGFEPSIADRMIEEGKLPVLARVRADGASAALDHGDARRTGLAWEHVATGLSPDAARRWSAVDFDASAYGAVLRPTATAPFTARLDVQATVFDPPYFDLARSPGVQGLTGWGAHDPGVEAGARPESLAAEIQRRFGPYPAERFIYGFVWPSEARTREMAQALEQAVDLRADIAEWLLAERLPDWELGFVVVSEYHSALEALWHGVDPSHPLHHVPSAAPAREGVEAVYRAADRLMGRLIERFPDTDFVFFNLHGMGPNSADAAGMALLPELLFRFAFGRPAMREGGWPCAADGTPLLAEDANWTVEVLRLLPARRRAAALASRIARRFSTPSSAMPPLDWMPGWHYGAYWPRMPAFALPSFYDGRIRLNLKGRERRGLVEPGDHARLCDTLTALLSACTDPRTGEPAVAQVLRTGGDPLAREASDADLVVVWNGCPLGLSHPDHGRIGPLPYRRTGGHTGGHGAAYFWGPRIRPGAIGLRDAFDVVPTAIELLGQPPLYSLSGSSFAREILKLPAIAA